MEQNVKKDSTVSVALATYNGEKYIREILDSVLAQSYPVSEIIIADDQSTDSTMSIAAEYAEKYEHIQILPVSDLLGFVKNFERCCRACRGDYIALCDQDDYWDPKKIEVLLSYAENDFLLN